MNLRQSKSFLKAAMVAGFGIAAVSGQTQDNSGNGLLNGKFQFRNVAVQNVDSNNNPSQVTATYGLITFDGNGNYTVTGSQVDNTVSGATPQVFTTTGVYAIGSSEASALEPANS